MAVESKRSKSEQSKRLLNLQAAALKEAANAIVITDRDANILWVNAAFEQLTGYSCLEILGENTRKLKSGEHTPAFYKQLWETILSGKKWQGNLANRRKDGSLYWEEMTITPLRNEGGKITHFVAIKQDISKSKRADQEILFKTALLEAQAEATIDGILAVDESNRIILSNQRFGAIWHVPEAILLKGEDAPLLQHVTDQVESAELFRERVEYLYNHREEKSQDELRLKDGRIVDRYSSPLIDSGGRYCGRVWYFRDVTESKQAAEKVRASEEQFRQLAENIREVFFVLTPNPPRVTYVSPAYEDIWGRPAQQLYERPENWLEFVHGDDRERVRNFYARCLQGKQAKCEYRVMRPDGGVRWIEARGFPVQGEDGKLMRVVGLAEDISTRMQKEQALETAHQQLNAALQQAEQQAHDTSRMAELVDILLSCQTVEEAYSIAANVLPSTFSAGSGALCITSASRNVVEAVAVWGTETATERAFTPDECWALRRGKVHRVRHSESPLRCGHVKGVPTNGYLCVPLAAHGETLGVLYLECPPASTEAGDPMTLLERQARHVGERVSLTLTHLRLREALQRQSVRDPLTGLFNRRFMEESLERELGRAIRNKQPVALVMMDIDHFKDFNDTFGHQAGDTLLRGLGDFLKQRTRGQDVACRYGGEEFAFILGGAAAEAAQRRAERLRAELAQLNLHHGGQLLGSVTVSIGVAAFPEHASSAEALIRAADEALYRAKKEGRDRVVLA